MEAKPSGHGSVALEATGRRMLGPGMVVAAGDRPGELEGARLGEALASRLGLGEGRHSGGMVGPMVAQGTPDEAAVAADEGRGTDSAGLAGVAASPVSVTDSNTPQEPRTAPQRGRR
jgi:hypothetical protein